MIKLEIEVADTQDKLAKGLMFRESLPENSGMLFKFNSPFDGGFWGKNTYIPLDVAFIDRSGKISSIKSITPMSTKIVRSNDLCSMAIEANAGFFRKNKINEGHRIEIISNSEGFEKEIIFKND